MGMTPLEGVMMGTRSGNIDPAIITHLITHDEMTVEQVDRMLEYES